MGERAEKDALLADGGVVGLQLCRLLQVLDRLLLLLEQRARHRAAVQRLGLVGLGEALGHGHLLRVAVEPERARRRLDAELRRRGAADLERDEGAVEEEREAQGRVLGLEGEVPLGEVEVSVEVCEHREGSAHGPRAGAGEER